MLTLPLLILFALPPSYCRNNHSFGLAESALAAGKPAPAALRRCRGRFRSQRAVRILMPLGVRFVDVAFIASAGTHPQTRCLAVH
jgi:hypothetical protein